MNVLILTPDAVGSTLLQRLITIYMQFQNYDRPVINLHELTNGLVRYHNTRFNQEVLGKKDGKWGYYQTLEQIVELLRSVDHYKTTRLAHYHIKNRQDSLESQIPFYQYLNDNFYIISCRRHNVFEHALSMCLSKVSKRLNVYTPQEKVDSYFNFYKEGIELDPNSLLYTLHAYKEYIEWSNNHFNVANYFYYDEHLARIENYILSLPIFAQKPRLTWDDNFGMSFGVWNKCHRMTSDLGTVALSAPEAFEQLTYTLEQDPQTGTAITTQTVLNLLPEEHKKMFAQNEEKYSKSMIKMQDMVDSGILVTPPPIKKQTLAEKRYMIKNYQSLLDAYNRWIEMNPEMGYPVDNATLDQFADLETANWNPSIALTQ